MYLGWSFLHKNALLCCKLSLTFGQKNILYLLTGKLEKMTKRTLMHTIDYTPKIVDGKMVHPKILAEVVYGLISRNCKGMGICKINAVNAPDYPASSTPCGASLAYLQVLNPSTIRFEFLKHSITPEQYTLRFASGYFCLEEAFCFSDQFLMALGTSDVTIAEGNYLIQDDAQFTTVDFFSLVQGF
ncbi:hypothetical protein [Haliscomenobacter sp.]|uniref:hypothetical protein n=1 Tax=Haliscomenobacter sp. TaxID=2717303 RepID=UPI0035930E79